MCRIFCLFLFINITINLFAQDSTETKMVDINFYHQKILKDSSHLNSTAYSVYKTEGKKDQLNITWHDWLTNIPKDYEQFYYKALDTSIPLYLGIVASTASLMATDNITWPNQHNWYKGSNFVHQASDRFAELGDGRTQFALTGIFLAYGFIFKDYRALRTGSQIIQVTLSAGAFVQVLKHLTGRESPIVSTEPAGQWKFFPNPLKYHKHVPAYDAYPSGHLTTMLAMIGVISENYPEWTWVKPAGYAISTLMAIGMVNNGIHWYSDYPLAIFLGYQFGKIVSHPENYYSHQDQGKVSYNIMPYYNYNGSGLTLQVKF